MARLLPALIIFAIVVAPAHGQLDIPDVPPGELAQPQVEPEVLTRGPVHEAFAELIAGDPLPGLIVQDAPPEPIDEVPPEFRPEGDNVVWIPGYWWFDEEASEYLWVSGVWRAIPPDQRWVAGYWHEVDGGFQWVSGFFSNVAVDNLVYQAPPPASLDNGPTVPAPSVEHFWSPGYWDTDYRWHAGYWQPYQDNRVWIPSRWVMTPHGCVFVPGHWDYDLPNRGQLFAPIRFRQPWRPGFVYRPTCAIQAPLLSMHLFVRPLRRTYYFGDWYDECNTLPIYTYSRFHTRRIGYCPIYAQNRARYARRGVNLSVRLDGWFRYYSTNRTYRPRRTFTAQRSFARQ